MLDCTDAAPVSWPTLATGPLVFRHDEGKDGYADFLLRNEIRFMHEEMSGLPDRTATGKTYLGRSRLHPYITKKEKFEPPLRDRISDVDKLPRVNWNPLAV